VLKLKRLVFKERIFPVNANFWFAIYSVCYKVSAFDELVLNNPVEASLLVARRFAIPQGLAGA
jgi:hypothetical protein